MDELNKTMQLKEEDLNNVAGGANQEFVVECSYKCPISSCGKTHTFNMQWFGTNRGFDVISYNACSKTKELYRIRNVDAPSINVTDTDGKYYTVNYKEERMI